MPGDPRGWHTRKDRQHVDGDYKCPPPLGKHDTLHEHSKGLMLRDEVTLHEDHQQIVLDCLAESLAFNEIPCVVMSVSSTHAHVLARFVRGRSTSTGKLIADPARHYFGIARKVASRRLSESGNVPPGGLWSKRTTIVPIADQRHFENVADYIQRHQEEGAVIWVNNPPDAHGYQSVGNNSNRRPRIPIRGTLLSDALPAPPQPPTPEHAARGASGCARTSGLRYADGRCPLVIESNP